MCGTDLGTESDFHKKWRGFRPGNWRGFFEPFFPSGCPKNPRQIHATQMIYYPQIHAIFGKCFPFPMASLGARPGVRSCFGCQCFYADQPRLVS